MRTIPVYMHLQKRERFLNLDFQDAVIVGSLSGLVLIATDQLFLSLGVALFLYVLFYLIKRNKPAGYTAHWLRFHISPQRYRGGP